MLHTRKGGPSVKDNMTANRSVQDLRSPPTCLLTFVSSQSSGMSCIVSIIFRVTVYQFVQG